MIKNLKSLPFGILLTLPALYATSLYSYLLFHCLVEMFSVVIACGIFMIAWNSRRFANNGYLLFLGIAYLFIGFDDLLHTLAYRGMGVFPDWSGNLATQLWIVARYTESLSLLIAPVFITARSIHPLRVFVVYTLSTILLLGSIFYLPLFPDCFLERTGLTFFKKVSEGIVCLFLAGAAFHLSRYREQFHRDIFRLLLLSIVLTIAAELAFIWYVEVYDVSNLFGHIFKFLSFYSLYVAMIEMSLMKPYETLFADLKQRETTLTQTNRDLQWEIDKRKEVEKRLTKINAGLLEMKQALEMQLDHALEKKNHLTRKLSELLLKKSDLSQSHLDMVNRLKMAEIENQELRKQLSYYFETLQETNQEIARIWKE